MLNQAWLKERLLQGQREGCFPAAAAAVGVHGQVLARAFVGEAPERGGAPVDGHTRWDMASLSKVLGTAMVALRAMEEGKIALQERVEDFFPEAPDDKARITVDQLLTHTGGFAPFFRLDRMGIEPSEAVRCILERPLEEKPGTRPVYSCMGFILLAKMLEKRLGAPLDALAERLVFHPLGMEETGYCPPPEALCAATERDPGTGKALTGVVHDENARFLGGVSGNAGVFMPLEDGIRFAGMLACGGKGLLREDTLALAIRNHTPGQAQHRGLGFQIAGTPDSFFSDEVPAACFGHTGFTGTSLLVEPESGFWVLLLTNRVCPTRENTALFPFRRRLHAEAWRLFRAPLEPEEFYGLLSIPGEVRALFSGWDREGRPFADGELTRRLLTRTQWTEAEKELEKRIGEDPGHLRLLWEETRIVEKQWPAWCQKGIPEEVFRDTMGFIPRYLKDGRKAYGRYCFTAGWWFPRQMAMELFRLGSLEYEMVPWGEEPRAYLHIPTDASLTEEALDDSVARFRAFAAAFFPEAAHLPLYCESWLMSPVLGELLPPSSRILAFQRRFRILSVNRDSMDAVGWVFPGQEGPPERLRAETALQKSMKAFLAAGGKPGEAVGIMEREKGRPEEN